MSARAAERRKLPDRGLVRRPSPPSATLPLSARSVGWGYFGPGQFEDQHIQRYAKLMWTISGTGRIWLGGRARRFPAGTMVFLAADSLHKASGGDDVWHVRWMTMDGPMLGQVLSGCGLDHEGVYRAPACPGELLDALRDQLADVSPRGEAEASALCYRIIALSALRPRPVAEPSLVEQAVALLRAEWSDPAMNVEALARRLGVHRSVLSRSFSAGIGISPKEYLTRLRLQRALSLLRQTDAPVAQIALSCGYEDASYFTRLFRKTQGLTPLAYRSH